MTRKKSQRPTSPFLRALAERNHSPTGRRWIFVPYDQVTDSIGPLQREDPRELGIVLVESAWKGNRRPYHRQKIALIIANLRQFALEQADRGVAIHHVVAGNTPYRDALRPAARKLGPLRVMRPAERELRVDLAPLVAEGAIEFVPHEGWLTTEDQFRKSQSRGLPCWKMESFYRLVRQETGILMAGSKPVGGQYSFDADNRQPYRGEPTPPTQLRFPMDSIKAEVGEMIDRHFSHHPGELDLDSLPTTRQDAENLWAWAKQHALPLFGPFEDAMCRQSSTLFHTRLSSLLNIGRLLPRRLVLEAEQLAIDLPSKEGFIRQILGWREFVHHVHEATDGFRQDPLRPGMSWPSEGRPGSGGYEEWKNEPWPVQRADSVRGADEPDGGAAPTYLGPGRPMLPAYWGVESGLACLDRVVADVWREGYSHHITRLMVLANIASLLDLSPRAVTDWFWVAYTDAYDWVVEPNVLAMGMFAVGPVMTTKPYVAGSAYIHRMSDYCGECSFDPKKNCPLARLYWAYLNRHADALADNPRLSLPLASAARRPSNEQALDRLTFEIAHRILSAGGKLRPDDFVPVDTLQKHSPKR